MKRAGFWKRVLAALIDSVAMLLVAVVFGVIRLYFPDVSAKAANCCSWGLSLPTPRRRFSGRERLESCCCG